MKSRDGKSQREEKSRREKIREEKKEDAGARKGRKVAKHCVFPKICGSRGSKSRFTKTGGCGAMWKLRCRKSERRCVAKHILKSKGAKHIRSHMLRQLLEVAMLKKCTSSCREAHLEV